VKDLGLRKVGDRYVVPPAQGLGTAIAFMERKQQ
jgi:hypothetical protein